MVLSQHSVYQASSRKRMHEVPKPPKTDQHALLGALGSTTVAEWFLHLLQGEVKLLAKGSHDYFSPEITAINLSHL